MYDIARNALRQAFCITIRNAYYLYILQYYYVGGALRMSFQIKSDKKETENKTIRFPLQLVQEIEQAIQGKDTTFSGFVIQACRYALQNLKPEK